MNFTAENKRWTGKRIRGIFIAMDRLTGLKGAGLPIRFIPGEPGEYFRADPGDMHFLFPERWLTTAATISLCTCTLVRHAYVHYMIHMLYPNSRFDLAWKKCSWFAGAYISATHTDQEKGEYPLRSLYPANYGDDYPGCPCETGQRLIHAEFGPGVVRSVECSAARTIALLEFSNNGRAFETYRTSDWVSAFCLPCA